MSFGSTVIVVVVIEAVAGSAAILLFCFVVLCCVGHLSVKYFANADFSTFCGFKIIFDLVKMLFLKGIADDSELF